MQSLRWTVRVDRFSRKSAPNTYQSELVACKQGGATLELTYRFPGTGKVVRDELGIFREAYPFPEEAKVSIEGDLLIPLDLASELPYWMPLSSSSPLKKPLYWSRKENGAVAMAFGMLAWTAHESQRLNQAHARGVWFEQKGDDLYGTIYLHAAEACPRVADDEPEHVIDRRIFQLVFQPLSVCIDVHDLDYKPMGSLLLRFEGGVVQKFDIILNMLMRKQHFDPSLLAHRFPLAPESAFGKQVSSEARGSAKSVESRIAACSGIAPDGSEIDPAELWAFLQKLLDGANFFDITAHADGTPLPVLCRARCEVWVRRGDNCRYGQRSDEPDHHATKILESCENAEKLKGVGVAVEYSLPFVLEDDNLSTRGMIEPIVGARAQYFGECLCHNGLDLVVFENGAVGVCLRTVHSREPPQHANVGVF